MGWTLIAISVLSLSHVQSDDPPTAAAVTAASRSMERALDLILRGHTGEASQARTLVFLVDPTTSVVEARFASELETALERNASFLQDTRLGLAFVGEKSVFAARPTKDSSKVLAALREGLARPKKGLVNVYADIRRLAANLAGQGSRSDLVLVSLENGDAEDDLEGTVAYLRRLRFSAITRESYLADSYWAARVGQAPRGCRLTGGDAPFIDLPWGWLFQQTVSNEVTPSGLAQYGLNRLAAASGGRIFLYAPPQAAEHKCAIYGWCAFCNGREHILPEEAYRTQSLKLYTPSAGSRNEAAREAAADPYFRAVHRAWKAASRAGLIRSRPSLKTLGTRIKLDQYPIGRWIVLTDSRDFPALERRAMKSAARCKEILRALEADIARVEDERRFNRHRAVAELTRVMLRLTHVNLMAFRAWCHEVAPKMNGRERLELKPPEKPWFGEDQLPHGIGVTNIPLCHGVRPFLELDLPGEDSFRRELEELDAVVRPFLERYAHTPFAVALRRSGIARFHFTFPGRGVPPPRVRPRSSTAEDPLTERGRATRPGGAGGSTTGTGPTTGRR